MKKNIIILVLLLKSCIGNNGNPVDQKVFNAKQENYEDINLFVLEGINKINGPASYPYVEIESLSDTEKHVVYHVTKEMTRIRNYKKNDGYWFSVYPGDRDTAVTTVYEYLFPNKIIELTYNENGNNKNLKLFETSVLENWKFTVYKFSNNLSINPGIDVIALTSLKAEYIYQEEIAIKNGILTLSEKRTDMPSYNINYVITLETILIFGGAILMSISKGLIVNSALYAHLPQFYKIKEFLAHGLRPVTYRYLV